MNDFDEDDDEDEDEEDVADGVSVLPMFSLFFRFLSDSTSFLSEIFYQSSANFIFKQRTGLTLGLFYKS